METTGKDSSAQFDELSTSQSYSKMGWATS